MKKNALANILTIRFRFPLWSDSTRESN